MGGQDGKLGDKERPGCIKMDEVKASSLSRFPNSQGDGRRSEGVATREGWEYHRKGI